jgi:hypothetical protein
MILDAHALAVVPFLATACEPALNLVPANPNPSPKTTAGLKIHRVMKIVILSYG